MKNSLRLLAAAGVSLLAVATASAADLPSRKMAPVAPVAFVPAFTWTGFYVGLQGGYRWNETKGTVTSIPVTVPFPVGYSYDSDAWMIGAHVGYNYQINQFVIGLEGDLEWADAKKTAIFAAPVGWYHRTSMEWQASLRARFGIAFDRTLLYVTGGLAYADIGHAFGFAPGGVLAPATLTYSQDKWGWTVGAGVEHAFTNNLTARLEYRYTDFGRISAASATFADSAKISNHAIRAGVSYKF